MNILLINTIKIRTDKMLFYIAKNSNDPNRHDKQYR